MKKIKKCDEMLYGWIIIRLNYFGSESEID